MESMKRTLFVLTSIVGFCGTLSAQTVYDVVSSLSDRQRVLVQRDQVSAQLINEYGSGSVPVPDDSPISWVGVGSNPSEASINAQSIGVRIALINQAVAEFDRIAAAFANVSVAELESSGPVGTVDFHRTGDFTPLPRATPENHQEVLLWPSAFEKTSFSGSSYAWEDIDNGAKVLDEEGMSTFSWLPSKIGASNLDSEESATTFLIGQSDTSTMTVGGTYYEDPSWDENVAGPIRTQDIGFSISYPKRAIVRATAQGAQGTQIDGTVKILSRSRWHELSVLDAPSRFNPANGSFVIEGGGSSGDVSIFSTPPGTSINGSWVTTDSGQDEDGPWLVKKFVETGYQLKSASLLHSSAQGYSNAYHRAYEKNWAVGCRFFSLFVPNFSRGVDAGPAKTKLDSVNGALADNTADGALLLHPRPSQLFGIDLGPGLTGAGAGLLGAGAMPDALENDFGPYDTGTTYGALGDVAPVRRFDSTYALRISGSVNDYHVVYENDRSARTQSLPQLAWPYDDPSNPGNSLYDLATLYRDWERPRLKQVVGRDLIANVVYNANHYGGYTITVYRRPETASAPVAGQTVDVEGLPVVRTWTFTKPGAGTTAHPTDPEELQVDGNANEKWRKEIGVTTTDLSFYEFEYETTVETFQDSVSTGVLTSETLDPFGDASPSDWTYAAAGKTITGTPTLGDGADPSFRYGKLTDSLGIDFDGVRPDTDTAWNEHGLLSNFTEGPWTIEGEPDGTAWKLTRKHGTGVIGTEWIEFTGPSKIKRSTVPDGASVAKGHASVASSEVEMGTLATGMPGLPHQVSRSDGTGATYAWTIAADGSGSLIASEGLLSAGSISKGRELTTAWNKRGFTTSSSEKLLLGGSLKIAGAAVPEGEFTDWGMPKKWKDDFSTIASSWAFDGNRSRTSSITSPLGLTTGFSGFDVLDRPGEVTANGITADRTFTGLSVQTDFEGTDIEAGTQNTTTSDALGRLTVDNTTWNGVVDNLGLVHGANTVDATRTVGPYGTHTSKIRQTDGSLEEAGGSTLPFGGLEGDGLAPSSGLLVSRTEILDEQGQGTGAFEEIHTDALGRVRKIVTPSRSGVGSATTSIHYSDPDSSFRQVITVEASGRVAITESDSYGENGSVSRSGIDLDFSSVETATLGASDRYTESVTSVSGGKVVTVLSVTDEPGPGVVNGLREVMRSEWTPSTGVTVTKINGNEETITSTPNRTTKTVTTTSSKGWTRTTALNSLGLPTTNTLSGTGIPTTELTPVWRADGSLASVELEIGGESHTAGFNHDGTLSSLTVPGKGNILGGHNIANGVETLTVNGVTVESQLNGTGTDIIGGNAIGRSETLEPDAGGFKHTVTPDVGGSTDTVLSAGFAPTSKNYADNSGEIYDYESELLKSVTLARGGELEFGYSGDGAVDLTSATWPAVTSGEFSIPGLGHGFSYTRAGQIKTVADPSGSRTLGYEHGRLVSTHYTAGSLRGYEVIRAHDGPGRHTGTTLERDEAFVHSVERAPNGASDQITALASGTVKVVPQRDAAGRITGYQWGNATGTFLPALTQTWQRGAGGRIEYAGSDVPGAPSFDYLLNPGNPGESFDTQGRRLKCETEGGVWTYTYGINGQIERAVHRDASNQILLGDFQYDFDAVGRRTDQGAANLNDLLNQTTAWSHDQIRNLRIRALPGSNVRIEIGDDPQNYEDLTNFSGDVLRPLPAPGANGLWVDWYTRAVLPGAGEGSGSPPANPLAAPDAKAEKRGSVWIPPASETLAYDDAGNRQGNAQWDYGWDAKNQLVHARTKDYDSGPQGWHVQFTYDAEGRRTKKHVVEYRDGAPVSEKEVTFVWDGWDLLYERHQLPSGLTILERKYLWGPDILDGSAGGAGGLLLIRETKGNVTTDLIPLYDGTGHVIALTNLNKDLLATYAYGPFGEKISANGPRAQGNPWRYATKYLDEETGLYYFGHRYYDPVTGQWLSREPLGENESINLYSYAHNDPINGLDVLGLKTKRFTNLGIEELEKIWGKGFFQSWVQRQGYSPVARQDWMETQNDFFDQYVAGLGYSPIEGSYSEAMNAPIVNPIHHGTHQYFMWQGSGGENIYIVPHNFWGRSQTPFGWSVSDTWEEAAAEIKQQAFYGSGVLETSRNVIAMGTGATQGNLIGVLGRLRTPVNTPMLMKPTGNPIPHVASKPTQARFLEYKTLRTQGYNATDAHGLMRQFDDGINPNGNFLFHFAYEGKASFSLVKGIPRTDYGFGVWRGVYTGTTPTPSSLLKNTSPLGWGVPGRDVRMPILVRPEMDVARPLFGFPLKTRIIRTDVNLLLPP